MRQHLSIFEKGYHLLTIIIFSNFSNVQGVGRFILTRVESAYMSRYGVKSVLKREHGGGFFANLIIAAPEPTLQKTVTDVEMGSVTTAGNAGSFQKFDDIQGEAIFCFRYVVLYYLSLLINVVFFKYVFSETTESSVSDGAKVQLFYTLSFLYG